MDEKILRDLVQALEKEARSALSADGSFLEILQALKWQVDSDPIVRSATDSLSGLGTKVFTSLVPRTRIRLYSHEAAFARSKDDGANSKQPQFTNFDRESENAPDPLTRDLVDAANAAVIATPYCDYLDAIVNESVKANPPCDRLTDLIESAGYEVQISVEVSCYAQIRERSVRPAMPSDPDSPKSTTRRGAPTNINDTASLDLSDSDLQFLKDLRIGFD